MTKKTVLQWGVGQQSTALVVMAIEGRLKVDAIIFCDTMEEMPGTYEALEYYKPLIKKAGIKLIILDRGYSLYDHFYKLHKVPLGIINPYCSSHFKRDLADSYYRKEWGVNNRLYKKNIQITEYMGISTDEIQRVKPGKSWKVKEYPLIDMNMSRTNCVNYLEDRGLLVPVKSGCWLCPNKPWSYFESMMYEEEAQFYKLIVLEDNASRYNVTLKDRPMKNLKRSENLDNWFEEDICDEGFCFT